MNRITLHTLVLALFLPVATMPYQATKGGITLEAQDLTHIPLGNLFVPQNGDRQDVASIDVSKELNLCLIGISIKNDSTITFELDPMTMSPYAHQKYELLSDNISRQDNKFASLQRKAITSLVLAAAFTSTAALSITNAMGGFWGAGALSFLGAGIYYGAKATKRLDILKKDRKTWSDHFGIGSEPIIIEPGQTVKKVILLDRAVYNSKNFILSLLDKNGSSDAVVSFCVPLDNNLFGQEIL